VYQSLLPKSHLDLEHDISHNRSHVDWLLKTIMHGSHTAKHISIRESNPLCYIYANIHNVGFVGNHFLMFTVSVHCNKRKNNYFRYKVQNGMEQNDSYKMCLALLHDASLTV
jgi:hypothetical protein